MKVYLKELQDNPIKRIVARLSRRVVVVLTSGKKLQFIRGITLYNCENKYQLSEKEKEEKAKAMKFLGF